jgi:hypothetical protein
MKVRPILFSAPMMIAHAAGRKTMTRRVAKASKSRGWPSLLDLEADGTPKWGDSYVLRPGNAVWRAAMAPAAAGDVYYARETYRFGKGYDGVKPSMVQRENARVWYEADDYESAAVGQVRVSIHMPRWASRLVLEVQEVRLERLQAITEADAIAEGLMPGRDEAEGMWGLPESGWYTDPRRAYFALWQYINGEGSAVADPWVHVIRYNPIFTNIETYLKEHP